ncbi:HDOD domain-containing protein [Neptuniibacter sp. QD34_54]|uniref:HDOD domain-containing protein n=1 Tax=Neptuniibacter sp. QD34_54 TaxID=3398208 RepID=UPI0039F5A7EC
MFAKFKSIFGFSNDERSEEVNQPQSSMVDGSEDNACAVTDDAPKVMEHSRELTLSFISNLLGVRSLGTEESHQQERILRASLDEEMVGLSEESIPKLSKNALLLMNDLVNPDTPQSKIVSAIKEDPALAGKVISIANSPAFVGSGVVIQDLEHALSMLGQQRLRDVVLSSLVADKFQIDSFYFETFGKALWDHSSEVANNAKKICENLGGNPSLAYFVGLIHDVGKLIIFKKLIEIHAVEKQEPHPEVFSHLLSDFSHALTRRACEVWELPEHWCQPITDFQMATENDLKRPESIALFLANAYAELHALYREGEITEFELVWRLQQTGSTIDDFRRLYPQEED